MKCDVERHRAALDDAAPAVEEPDELVAVDGLALAHHGTDDRVEPRAVAATGEQSDSHRVHVTRARGRLYPAAPMPVRRSRSTQGRRACAPSPSATTGAPRPVVPRVHAALPAARLGRARRVRDLEGDAGDARRAVVEPRRADRGHRHHQPARDDRGLGSPHRPAPPPRDRVAGPAHGRALRRAAPGRAPRLVRSRTGLVLDPYFSGTKIEWLLRRDRST